MNREEIKNINLLIHAPVRLAVMTVLSEVEEADFTYLKEAVDTTDGNLSRHLDKLESADYVRIVKTYAGKKPRTVCSITKTGRKVFAAYLENLQKIINTQKGNL